MVRWCTGSFKVEPIDLYLSSFVSASLAIGLNFDEQGREGNLEKLEFVDYWYPLIELGYTRSDCEDILIENGLHPSFPVFMQRGGCRMCPFKTEKEYRAMYFLSREEFFEVMLFEEAIQDRRKKFYSIMGNGKSLRRLAEECENSLYDSSEYYLKKNKNETSCGLFCHR